MKVDSLRANLLAYALFALLSILEAVLLDLHRQIVNGGSFDYWMMADAAIVVIAPIVTNAILNMKLPSVGHEPIAAKVDAHEDRLRVTDPIIGLIDRAERDAGERG